MDNMDGIDLLQQPVMNFVRVSKHLIYFIIS